MNLKLAYLGLSLAVIIILFLFGSKAINKSTIDNSLVKGKKIILIISLLLWQAYVFMVASSDLLKNFSFPPRFALLLILPLFAFTGVFLYKNRNKNWIRTIPEHWLIFYQSFRIFIESIFVASVAQGILNSEVTIEGYNYDMIFAFTAPIVGFLLFKKLIPRKIVLFWNLLGLAVIASIIFLFMSSIFNPQLFGSKVMLLPKAAVIYPYVLVAGFIMPSAVFIHVLSIVQLSKKKFKIN